MIPTVPEYLERSSAPQVLGASLVLLVLAGFLDFLAGWEISLSVLYLLPIGLAAWFVNWKAGLALSAVGVLIGFAADLLAGWPYSHPLVPFWNSLAQFGIFAAVSFLASTLKRAVRHREHLAQVDSLTGLKRSELFFEMVGRQVRIAVRYDRPLTFAYIGVDNFKALNERYGHRTGDGVLVSIAQTLKQNLRDTDIVARLGGDEFGVFFPETGADRAKQAVEKVLQNLGEATEGWPITFSIGAVVCDHTVCAVDQLVRKAEALMHSVKRSGANNFDLQVLEEKPGSDDILPQGAPP